MRINTKEATSEELRSRLSDIASVLKAMGFSLGDAVEDLQCGQTEVAITLMEGFGRAIADYSEEIWDIEDAYRILESTRPPQ
jgi:hypothetical protein